MTPEIDGKRLELLKELVPRVSSPTGEGTSPSESRVPADQVIE
jgi:hypothetical protein